MTAKTKTYTGRIQFKAESDTTGEFMAEFATLNVIDHDGDVTIPGAFRDGQETMIEAWNHNYGALPIGKGTIHERDNKAVVDGQFFLDTANGLQHYKTVKNLGALQEWSYTFQIEDHSFGKFEDREVQFLRKLDVWGVAPVQRGAGIETRTTSIKGLKPYANEHSCRLKNPELFQEDSFRRVIREHEGKKYAVIMGKLKDDDTMTEQAYRYPRDVWDSADARKHCGDHGGRFEAAADSSGDDDEGQTRTGEPSGVPPRVVATQIEIDLLEV